MNTAIIRTARALVLLPAAWLFFCLLPQTTKAATLSIVNNCRQDILNIHVQPQKKEPFFWRLDLAPGASDKVENPGGTANLRVDTGLEFLLFKNIPLSKISGIEFCSAHPACILLEEDGKSRHENGQAQSLVPEKGAAPVCELDQFKPYMKMKDVCAKLKPDLPQDDNGAILTGLGFGGMVWAGRLAPAPNDNSPAGDSILEHLELRRPLNEADLQKLFTVLNQKGYIPWQAEFPGLDMNFVDMTNVDAQQKQELLDEALERFLNFGKKEKISANPGDIEQEASILMAPASMLSSLANADAPNNDVQLFTVILHPATQSLILDVSAYQGENNSRED